MLVVVGITLRDPETPLVPLQAPEAVHDVALVDDHVSVLAAPATIVTGIALNDVTVTGGLLLDEEELLLLDEELTLLDDVLDELCEDVLLDDILLEDVLLDDLLLDETLIEDVLLDDTLLVEDVLLDDRLLDDTLDDCDESDDELLCLSPTSLAGGLTALPPEQAVINEANTTIHMYPKMDRYLYARIKVIYLNEVLMNCNYQKHIAKF